jgi:hypothetical protein
VLEKLKIKTHYKAIIFSALLLVVFYPITLMHLEMLYNSNLLHEELRYLFIHHKIIDKELFQNDYFAQYVLKRQVPFGYDFLVKLFAKTGSLYFFHKLLPFILLYVTVASVAIASWKIGGGIVSFASASLAYFLSLVSYQIVAVIPHMFAFPVIGCFLLSVVFGRVYWMSIITIIGALIYVPVSIITGAVMACYLLFMPSLARGDAKDWSFYKRIIVLAFCGLIVVFNLYSMLQPLEGYGEPIKILEDTVRYPETGEKGRFHLGITKPLYYSILVFDKSFKNGGMFLFILTLVVCIFGLRKNNFLSFINNKNNQIYWYRLIAYIGGGVSLSIISFTFISYQSYRFILYGFYLFYCIIFPISIFILTKKLFKDTKLDNNFSAPIAVILVVGVMASIADIKNYNNYGYTRVPEEFNAIYNFVENTPKDTIFAGMPSPYTKGVKVVDYLPYFAKRAVLMNAKGHQVSYKDYLLEMRLRIAALIKAHYGKNLKPLISLRDDYGVDYIIIHTKDYEKAPNYFEPFGKKIEESFKKSKLNKPYLIDNLDKAVINAKEIYVFDLHKITNDSKI